MFNISISIHILTGGRNHNYSDDERQSTVRQTAINAMMLTPILREPRKLINHASEKKHANV